MELYQKVALRYASQRRAGVSATMVETDEFSQHDSTHGYDIYVEGESVGFIEGQLHFIEAYDMHRFECAEDMESLWELWGNDLPSSSSIPVFEITESSLDKEYHNKKLGLMMYKHIADNVRQEVSFMFFIPNYCYDSKTSDQARRIWKSLARSNTSSGDVILMVNNRLK